MFCPLQRMQASGLIPENQKTALRPQPTHDIRSPDCSDLGQEYGYLILLTVKLLPSKAINFISIP